LTLYSPSIDLSYLYIDSKLPRIGWNLKVEHDYETTINAPEDINLAQDTIYNVFYADFSGSYLGGSLQQFNPVFLTSDIEILMPLRIDFLSYNTGTNDAKPIGPVLNSITS
jgi:hypothetical protein